MGQHGDEIIFFAIGLAEHLLHQLPIGHVARGSGNRFHFPAAAENGNEDVVIDATTERADERRLVANRGLARSNLLDLSVEFFSLPIGICEFREGLADDFVPGASPEFQQHVVGIEDPLVEVEYVSEVGGIRKNGLIESLALS